MKKFWLTIGMVILLTFAFSRQGLTDDKIHVKNIALAALEGTEYVPGEIIVKFKSGVSDEVISAINAARGASVISTSRFAGFKRLKIPARRTVEEMAERYKKNPNVEYAEPNYIMRAYWIPNDPFYFYQWHLDNPVYGGIDMGDAWQYLGAPGTPGAGVIVAVIDSGVAYEDYVEAIPIGNSGSRYRYITYALAPDLADTTFVPGYDFVNDDAHPNDDNAHGTHVTGTIAQSTNNTLGVAGVAFKASIMPVKVLDGGGSGTYADVADGIYFAADNGAKVINMSLGGPSPSATLRNAVAYAYGKGVTIVCAAGNDGSSTDVSYPAAYDAYCIAVGATRYDEEVAYYSNRGASLDLTAPGGDLNVDQNSDGYGDGVLQQTHDGSDYTNFGYWFYQGTSMATPHVSGAAALLIADGVAATPDEVREALQSTAEDKGMSGWDTEYGWGIVNAYAALNYTTEPNNPPVADAGGPYSGTEDIEVTFDGSGSYDPDGDALTYSWDFGDGAAGSGIGPSHAYAAGGTYTVTLAVNDGKVNSDPSTSTAAIEEVNDPPVADAGPDQSAIAGETVTFDGSGSYDIDDGIVSYDWDFGDGTTGSGKTATHVYSTADTYTVTLTVTDAGGLTDIDTAVVTITEEPAFLLHVSNIDMALNTRKAGPNNFVSALTTVTVADSNGNPIDGATVYGSWSGAASDNDSGVTDLAGTVILESDEVKNPVSGTTFTFTVDNINKEGWTYDFAANVETSDSITYP